MEIKNEQEWREGTFITSFTFLTDGEKSAYSKWKSVHSNCRNAIWDL